MNYEAILLAALGIHSSMNSLDPNDPNVVGASIPTVAATNEWTAESLGNGHNYKHVGIPEGITWQDANDRAIQAGGYLATITSAAENTYAFSVLDLDSQYWNRSIRAQWGPWLGAFQLPQSKEPDGGWAWVTGEYFVYTAWGPGNFSGTWQGRDENRIEFGFHYSEFAPVWNDISHSYPISSSRIPKGYLIEYDRTLYEAEQGEMIEGGTVEGEFSGYTGTGYVYMGEKASNSIEWSVPVGPNGPRILYLRYANGTDSNLSLEMQINGQMPLDLLLVPPTGAWNIWSSLSTNIYLNPGENTIKIINSTEGIGPSIDNLILISSNTNLVLNKFISFSSQDTDYPASQAIDADSRTVWSAQGFPQWLEVDLGQTYPLGRTEFLGLPEKTYLFTIETKTSLHESYRLIVDHSIDRALDGEQYDLVNEFEPVLGRYVKLTILAVIERVRRERREGNGLSIAEFRVKPTTEWLLDGPTLKEE